MSNLANLDAAIRAVCSIHGVNTDRVISFKDEATEKQRAAAQSIADAWDFDAPDVPLVVTMRQARLALLQTGMLASVNSAVAAADEATKITWEFSSEVQRGHPFVATLAAALNLTEAQLDDLFTLAASL